MAGVWGEQGAPTGKLECGTRVQLGVGGEVTVCSASQGHKDQQPSYLLPLRYVTVSK